MSRGELVTTQSTRRLQHSFTMSCTSTGSTWGTQSGLHWMRPTVKQVTPSALVHTEQALKVSRITSFNIKSYFCSNSSNLSINVIKSNGGGECAWRLYCYKESGRLSQIINKALLTLQSLQNKRLFVLLLIAWSYYQIFELLLRRPGFVGSILVGRGHA